MPCKNCAEKPVIKLTNTNIQLCKKHFIRYFERKVLNAVHNYKLIEKEDRIGVAVSGGKDSLTVLNILNMLKEKTKKFEIEAIAIDEGISGYRDKTLQDAEKYCQEHDIKLHIFSYKDEFGDTLDNMLKKTKYKGIML